MKILDDFIKTNNKISIISNRGNPFTIPDHCKPVFDSCDMLVVIPDMHMYIYDSNLDNFKYGSKTMLEFLTHLELLKTELFLQGKSLRIYQIGDLYEQRFPGFSQPGTNASATEIRLSHADYDQILNMMDTMRTHFLYGNHDFELRHFPGFRYAALEGKVYLEHGFTADSWQAFSNPRKPLWEESQVIFKEIREVEALLSRMLVDLNVIKKDEHFARGVISGEDPRYDLTTEFVYDHYGDTYIPHFTNRLKAKPGNREPRICIIAHTHHPFLKTDIENGQYIYIDAGAWTEGRSDFAVITDEELAICCYRRV